MADDQHGAGADNSDGNGPDNSNGTGEPKYATTEQVNEIVNKAITGHLKRNNKSLMDEMSKAQSALVDQIVGKLKPPSDEDDDDQDEDDEAPDASGGGSDLETLVDKRLKAFQRKVERERKKDREVIERLQRERDEAKQAKRESDRQAALRRALEEHGISGKHAAHASTYLDRHVVFDEDDDLVFRNPGDREDVRALTDGIAQWAKTDDAKFYLPPRGVNGSGDRPPSTTGSPLKPNATPEEARAELRKQIGEGLKRV